MSKTRNLSDLLDANGDVKSTALDNVPASDLINDTTPQLGGNLDCNTFDISWGDNEKARFGNADDLEIYHDGTHSRINEQGTGDLLIMSNGANVKINKGATETTAVFTPDGAVELNYDNSKKFETTATGVSVTGNIDLGDNEYVRFGDSQDLRIYHDGSNSFIQDAGTGSLVLQGTNLLIRTNNGDNVITATENAEVTLAYDNATKLQTTSTGVSVTGDLSVTGSISGAGKVGQVVNTHTGNRTTFTMPNTNNATIITDLTTSITPSSTSSKILIQIMITHDAAWDGVYRLFRNSTDIGRNSASTARWSGFATIPYDADQNSTPTTQMLQYLDSPSTTSSVQYKIGVQSSLGSNETFYFNRPAGSSGQDTQEIGTSNMILMEILP